MVGSFYDPELEEGCAFEELISFHGGLGGPQTRAFILAPPELPIPDEPIVGAAARARPARRLARPAAGPGSAAADDPAPDRDAGGAAARRRGDLYLLLPAILDVFSSWPQLRGINLLWLGLAVFFEAFSFVALWTLQRIAIGTRSWFAVGTSQLAANAAGSIIPGGGAASGAVQYGMLVRAGVPGCAGCVGPDRERGCDDRGRPGAAGCRAPGRARRRQRSRRPTQGRLHRRRGVRAARARDRRRLRLGLAAGQGRTRVRAVAGWAGKRDRFADLPERLLVQRDGVRRAVSERPVIAALAGLGKWGFDYLALICVLEALKVRPEPALVLLAYSAAALLALIPLTPGGLGFVEAGLTGLLVLAGVSAGEAAAATLAYRLVSYWLPLPAGLVGFWLGRRRYGSDAPGRTVPAP